MDNIIKCYHDQQVNKLIAKTLKLQHQKVINTVLI